MSFVKKLFYKLKNFTEMDIVAYFRYNYFSKNVVREKGVYLIPQKGARIELMRGAKLYIEEKDLVVGANKVKHSKAETYVRLGRDAIWKCSGGILMYNSSVEVKERALFESGWFIQNSLTNIVCAKHIVFGDDVWLGRDVTVYDSDHHQMLDENGSFVNHSKPVRIGSHVWLTNHIMVMKGVSIGDGSVVSAYTVVKKDIPEKVLAGSTSKCEILRENINWSSKRTPDWGYDGD